MPKIDKETIWENVPPSASHSTPTHVYSADKRPKVVIDEIGVFDWLNGLCVCPTNNAWKGPMRLGLWFVGENAVCKSHQCGL